MFRLLAYLFQVGNYSIHDVMHLQWLTRVLWNPQLFQVIATSVHVTSSSCVHIHFFQSTY